MWLSRSLVPLQDAALDAAAPTHGHDAEADASPQATDDDEDPYEYDEELPLPPPRSLDDDIMLEGTIPSAISFIPAISLGTNHS